MEIKIANKNNIKSILEIINQAKLYMKEINLNQWDETYPNTQTISYDIENDINYILVDNEKIIGTFVLIFGEDETYKNIEGSWKTNSSYGTLHRVAIHNDYKGKNLAKLILDFSMEKALEKNIHSLRIDTHQKNLSMKRFIEKSNFDYCGIIYVSDGTPRIAFEKTF
ncbi:GNAT family N-acetyltransferase [Fusobacterium sp.]|uniref:GNAT family N-acetyltransferase n=1 Tax=Fusobacterium sp. TaxID=68766 RepID=UPI0026128E1F|nr:GNAT family N-acetyltransferase [Fusobacterium sp.]